MIMGISDLFDVIFSNIGFIILVLGGLYSFLKRNTNHKEQPKPPVPRKYNSPPMVEESKRYEVKQPEVRERIKPRLQEPLLSSESVVSEPVRRIGQTKKVVKVKTETRHNPLISNAPDHIIQGVIWSEILGPPKAKAPHLSRKTNRI